VLVVLGQRTITKGFVRLPSNYYYWVVALVVGLFALAVVASCVVFAAGPRTHSTSLHPSVASSALTQAPIAAQSASLDNDLDNDGQVDGIVDSLGAHPDGIANPLEGLGFVCLLIPSVGGSLSLLSLYKLPMVGCEYYLPLERPG
jgi:hypothetical protein